MQKTRKLIGVDFDDVIHSFNDALMAYYNAKYNTSLKREQVTEYYIEKLYGKSPEEMNDLFDEFCLSEHHHVVEPVRGAKEAITYISLDHKLVIITARPKTLNTVTQTWLDLHFPNIFHEIHYTRDDWKSV